MEEVSLQVITPNVVALQCPPKPNSKSEIENVSKAMRGHATAVSLSVPTTKSQRFMAVLKLPILDFPARMANRQIRRPCEGRLSRTSVPR
jgi:hypothetical protein